MSRIHISCTINGDAHDFLTPEDGSLLNALRDDVGLTGVKEGCGTGDCGACSVLLDGNLTCSCLVFAAEAQGADIVTVEGLADGDRLHAVQQAWIEEDVAQCGYCQAGQIMAAVDLLAKAPDPSDEQVASLTNLCRCGTYPRIRKAIKRAAAALKEKS